MSKYAAQLPRGPAGSLSVTLPRLLAAGLGAAGRARLSGERSPDGAGIKLAVGVLRLRGAVSRVTRALHPRRAHLFLSFTEGRGPRAGQALLRQPHLPAPRLGVWAQGIGAPGPRQQAVGRAVRVLSPAVHNPGKRAERGPAAGSAGTGGAAGSGAGAASQRKWSLVRQAHRVTE